MLWDRADGRQCPWFQHCSGAQGQEGRDRMVRAVDYLWKEAGLGRAWDLFRWVQQEGWGSMGEYSEWEEWWANAAIAAALPEKCFSSQAPARVLFCLSPA